MSTVLRNIAFTAHREEIADLLEKINNTLQAKSLEFTEMQGVLNRLHTAVCRRMMPDEPTPEDRIELIEAYAAAAKLVKPTTL